MTDGLRWSEEDLAAYLARRLAQHAQDRQVGRKPVLSQPEPVQAPSTRKYRNQETVVNGRRFDSKKEAERFCQLQLLERVGSIRDLECQPRYDLIACNGEVVGHFKPDFCYFSVELGRLVVEDVKSPITKRETAYRLRKRLFEACHGIILTEI